MATLCKRNDKWHVQIRRKDHPSRTKSFISKKTAEKWVRETENRIDQGYLHQSATKLSLTLKELIIRYVADVLVKKRGCVNETIILRAFMRQPFVNKPLIQITSEDFAQYRDRRLEHVKPATLLRELCIVQHLYSTAKKEWGFDIPNPIKNIQKPRLNNRRERRLTKEEYEFLITDSNHRTLRNIIVVAIETAMRRSEILHVQSENIKGQILLIPRTKNGHSRTIPLTKKAKCILENSFLPFPMSANALGLAWKRLRERGNIKDLHFHDLRHEAISRFFEKGLSIPEVALISGHKDVRMLFRYTHLRAGDIVKKL